MKINSYRVIIQEDDKDMQRKIADELKGNDYNIQFVPKDLSVFDVMNWNPDIIISDYSTKEIIKCYEWNTLN
jgi:CheY-like chemotaxis protein